MGRGPGGLGVSPGQRVPATLPGALSRLGLQPRLPASSSWASDGLIKHHKAEASLDVGASET